MWLKAAWALLRKDALIELRRRESLFSMAAFGVLSLLIYNFALPLDGDSAKEMAPGLLWVTVTFTAVLSLGKAFAGEKQNDAVDALVASPAPLPAIFLGKLAANLLFIGIIEILLIPLFLAFFPVATGFSWGWLALTLGLGTFGMATLGTLFSAMTVTLRSRELIFPLLLLPLMVPIIIAASHALSALIEQDMGAVSTWVQLLGIADTIFFVASLWVFEFLVED